MSKKHKLKRAIVTEELFALVREDLLSALVLRQLIYWSVRVRDVDEYIDELSKYKQEGEQIPEKTHGWIYKKSSELADEIMSNSSEKTIRRRLTAMVKSGWIDERKNPKNPYDRTKQYRVNLGKTENDLNTLGYSLATVMGKDFPLVKQALDTESVSNGQNDVSLNGQNDVTENHGDVSLRTETTLIEITPENCLLPSEDKKSPQEVESPTLTDLYDAIEEYACLNLNRENKTIRQQLEEMRTKYGITPSSIADFVEWWKETSWKWKESPGVSYPKFKDIYEDWPNFTKNGTPSTEIIDYGPLLTPEIRAEMNRDKKRKDAVGDT